jgi:hypothetical protein
LSIGDFNETAVELRAAQRESDRQQLVQVGGADAQARAARERVAQLSDEILPMRRRASFHKLFGIASALVTMLVNSVAITYFVGTSRWCLEVSDAYHLDLNRVEQVRRLKRRTFASALVSMLTIVLLAGLGAAADPGNSQSGGQVWVLWHLNTAFAGAVVVCGIFWYQAGKVRDNYAIIQQIMADVRQIRDDHGLDRPAPSA